MVDDDSGLFEFQVISFFWGGEKRGGGIVVGRFTCGKKKRPSKRNSL